MSLKNYPKISEKRKIKAEQRGEALRRNREFIDDTDQAFERFLQGRRKNAKQPALRIVKARLSEKIIKDYLYSPEAEEVAAKYELIIPWHYKLPWRPLFEREKSVRVIPHKKPRRGQHPVDGRYLSPHLKDSQFLTVTVDLRHPKELIMAEFEFVIERYLRHAAIPKGPKRRGTAIEPALETPGGEVSIFAVWDKKHKEVKTAWQITQELFPDCQGKSPNDYSKKFSEEARTRLRQIERAIQRADNLITEVSRS